MGNGRIFDNCMGNITIQDINTDSHNRNDDAFDANYSTKSNYTEVSLPSTIVDEDDNNIDNNALSNMYPNNYYKQIANEANSDDEQFEE